MINQYKVVGQTFLESRLIDKSLSRLIQNNTENLELPSITQVPNSGAQSEPWITQHQSKRPILSTDRVADLHLSHLGTSGSPSYATDYAYDPKNLAESKHSTHTPHQSETGLRTPSPSPTSRTAARSGSATADLEHFQSRQPSYPSEHYAIAMNQHQPNYLETQHAISGGQQYAPHPSTANNMNQYAAYQGQPSPSVHQYSQPPSGYAPHYAYGGGMASPHGSAHHIPTTMGQVNSGLPSLPSRSIRPNDFLQRSSSIAMQGGQPSHYVGTTNGATQSNYPQPQDPSGQIAPTGMKPRVTATLWEDEGCMCFQVETKGVCVARRDGTQDSLPLMIGSLSDVFNR